MRNEGNFFIVTVLDAASLCLVWPCLRHAGDFIIALMAIKLVRMQNRISFQFSLSLGWKKVSQEKA